MPFDKPEEWVAELGQFSDTLKGDPPASIADAVRDDTWRQILAYYANENLVMENVSFLAALGPLAHKGDFPMDEGKKIYEQFVSSSSSTQVNLPGGIQKALEDIYKDNDDPIAPPDHFDAAYDEIVSMCDADTYTRFKKAAAATKEHLNSEG
jgi:hypothetical protein